MDWEQMNQEYQNTAASFAFTMPANTGFPLEVPEPHQENVLYQTGFGEMRAYVYAECTYWAIVAQNQSTDVATALAALDSAQQIHNSPVYQRHYEDPDGEWDMIVNRARLGDFSVFMECFQNDCGAWFPGD